MTTKNESILRPIEIKITHYLCNFVPKWCGTKQLTFLSFFSSILVFISYYLASLNPLFLFLASFGIMLQWIFDCLDGTIGRMRNQGFVKWGYYMDHFFDYFFMSSIFLGWMFVFPESKFWTLVIFFTSSSIMFSFMIMHDVLKNTQKDLETSFNKFSPIEFRLTIIFINFFIFFETGYNLFDKYLPIMSFFLVFVLVNMINFNQKRLHKIDLSYK